MSRPSTPTRQRRSIEAQFALAEKAWRGLNKSINAQLERERDLEVERADALYKAGKATVRDGHQVIAEARRRLQ